MGLSPELKSLPHLLPPAQLLTASVLFSSALSVWLYAKSFARDALLNSHGNTGYLFYDFWMGRELNPRVSAWAWMRQHRQEERGISTAVL